MADNLQTIELQRERWRRARVAHGLADPQSASFATGGLGRFVSDIRFRVLVLPADPERHVVDFTEDVRDWWMQERRNPFDKRNSDWGSSYRTTANAAIRYSGGGSREPWQWDEHLTLHRSGGIEFGGGGGYAVYPFSQDVSVFRLIYMVGRLWSSLHLYAEVIERFSLIGPWELAIALRNTKGSYLGHLATGWANPGEGWERELLPCPDPNLLIVREITDWPTGSNLNELVFSVAASLENAWGSSNQRYIARGGQLAGQFDSSKYR